MATGGTVSATGTITSSDTITGGNLATGGTVSATGTITSADTITGGNIATGGTVSATGTGTFGNVATGGTVSSTGTITGGNVATGGTVSATGSITGGSIATGTTVSAAGTITGGNVATGGTISSTGTATVGNVATGGTISSTGTATVGNVDTGGAISATGNITGNHLFGNYATIGNVYITGDSISGENGIVNINQALGDVDFAVNGDTTANVLFVDAGTETVSIGSATQTTDVILAMNATTSFLQPVGNTAQRPATGVTGMLRFNTTLNAVEVYDNVEWKSVGVQEITVITDDQFAGDDSTVAFTLSEESTTSGTIVAINGIQQIPTTAYSVSGTTITFTEAPATGDVIDCRVLTTTTTVTGIADGTSSVDIDGSGGNVVVEVGGTDISTFHSGGQNVTGAISASGTITGGNIATGGTVSSTGTATLGNVATGGTVSATGTITGGNVATGGTISASGTITGGNIATGGTVSSTGTATLGNVATGGTVSATGTITGGNVATGGTISATGTVTGTSFIGVATSAQYADLAENYAADAKYAPGTVVSFGGEAEVTSSTDADTRVAGVVSTNPAYTMNSDLVADHVVTVAFTGRVPCKVTGTVRKGDLMVSAGNGLARAEANPAPGTIIGKALADHDGAEGVIEVVVGRF